MNADNVAECESCGMKYAKEKIAQMVKIDGAVEITKGEAEKERLLKNAETFLNLGKHVEAEDLCKKLLMNILMITVAGTCALKILFWQWIVT